jgi:kynurenine formamidase
MSSQMKFRTFVIGYCVALALLLFAQRHPQPLPSTGYRAVIDLTHSINGHVPTYEPSEKAIYQVKTSATFEKDHYFARNISLPEHYGTHIDAPAHFARGSWTVDQIPAERLVVPLVIIDVHQAAAANADYQLSMDDIATWEQKNGQVPMGSVVMARTGWDDRWNSEKAYRNADGKGTMHFPGFSLDAAKFLVEARNVAGLGIDTLSIDYGPSKNFEVHQYTLAHGLYHLENVASLAQTPETGSTVVVGPAKLEGGSGGPVRILALVR